MFANKRGAPFATASSWVLTPFLVVQPLRKSLVPSRQARRPHVLGPMRKEQQERHGFRAHVGAGQTS